jgi:hypothetical protein
MSNQLPEMHKLDLDLCLMTSKLGGIETVNASHSRLAPKSVDNLPTLIAIRPQADSDVSMIKDIGLETLDWAKLAAGKSWLEIQHGCNPEDRQKPYYATSITNRSTEKIRIDRFGTYTRSGKTLILHSITGGFFSAHQFQAWYELGENT